MLGFVDGVGALVDQSAVTPAQPEVQHGAARGDREQLVMIAECHAQLIGLEAAIVGQVQGDQSWADELGDVV
ncbi:hypothetical protein JTL39_33005, partial [Pseudomonas aeruginosa]|nr:hypothetical protein [Pseudomonas aeruginosa]